MRKYTFGKGSMAFDESEVGPNDDPVDTLCKWCLTNLDQDQIEKLCEGLSLSQRSATLEGMDDDPGVTGYAGGRQAGPGNAGPYKTPGGVGPKAGAAMDAGLRAFGRSVTRDVALRDSFDTIFNPSASGSDSGRDDLFA